MFLGSNDNHSINQSITINQPTDQQTVLPTVQLIKLLINQSVIHSISILFLGRRCSECKDGQYNLRSDSVTGCEDLCSCNFVGSVNTITCEMESGNCSCIDGIQPNRQCVSLAPSLFGLAFNLLAIHYMRQG